VSGFAVRFHAADETPYALAGMLHPTLALNLRPSVLLVVATSGDGAGVLSSAAWCVHRATSTLR
jgi:hypothetical protein